MLSFLAPFLFLPFFTAGQPLASSSVENAQKLAYHEFSLNDRYGNAFVNDVFKDNILLTIDYATNQKINPANIDWKSVEKPFKYSITLKPGETFAFHNDVLPEYSGKVTKTANSTFSSDQGFKSDGYLVGDGVCHLASLLYWVAKDAGLNTLAPTRHDFAPVPDVPREFGTSIYKLGNKSESNELQNLYITNNKNKNVTFVFNYDGQKLGITANEAI